MKKGKIVFVMLALMLALSVPMTALADKPVGFDASGNETAWSSSSCAKIQDDTIYASTGELLHTGYDEFGYNYQAHLFNGTYDSSDRNLDGTYWGSTGDYVNDSLSMKWPDEWLANVDCNGDGKLDRGLVNGVVGGTSLGWTTNHVNGTYFDADGVEQHYTYFVKIVYVGPGGSLWGSYEVVQEVYNDPPAGVTGLLFKSDPGLGHLDDGTTIEIMLDEPSGTEE
ncbi:hypothetical protein A2415_04945 [candidate division WWE3 bacterium RIFOXYC1_FULL_39_7]|uniref:Uncharacterized protein n=1 Tax=candidate division WWE3 bacterium RIFOXYC1_FULL_39_7 TaxID=1802643 RepID=A0A1F4WM48_UNCKA|nr:MAG: hypothetical protein A2415_04945 [candidate division WWE3 bacterium RIFOXYC1_FULL_39_7]